MTRTASPGNASAGAHDRSDDSGFSLIEMVVSMVLLAVIAMAFLPLVTRTATAAARGATLVTATQLVSEQMEAVRQSAAPVCPPDRNGAVETTATDGRGVVLQVRTDRVDVRGSCAAGSSGLVRFTAWVTRSTEPTVAVTTASTLVSVGGP